ncbi:hypothetical protein GCM10011517_26470 [Actibacterium pelagium]|uniref:Uncharacterized protein n=1 Tax=Actibacterium pelagium TaxID=2029103 RepID=A0A917AJX9_9RHOB|nr:hypothetical protein GCM10011517_26470 [Actibacterium pelagium]
MSGILQPRIMADVGELARTQVAFENARHVYVDEGAGYPMLKQQYGVGDVLADCRHLRQPFALRREETTVLRCVFGEGIQRDSPPLPETDGFEDFFEILDRRSGQSTPVRIFTIKGAVKVGDSFSACSLEENFDADLLVGARTGRTPRQAPPILGEPVE